MAERVTRTLHNLLEKPVFEKGIASWISELRSVVNQYNKTNHNSMKMKPIIASNK